MGTTLANLAIKDSYSGILKTTDNTVLTAKASGHHAISDGAGNDSSFELATDGVKMTGLTLASLTTTSETNALVADTNGVVSKRAFPTNTGISVAPGGTDDPTLALTSAAGGDGATLTFVGGNGLSVSRSSNTYTFKQGTRSINVVAVTASSSMAAGDGNATHYLDYSSATAGDNITLPPAATGVTFKFVIRQTKPATFKIATAAGDLMWGKVIVRKDSDGVGKIQTVNHGTANMNEFKLIQNGTDTGGGVGDTIYFEALDATNWYVNAELTTSGTVGALATIS